MRIQIGYDLDEVISPMMPNFLGFLNNKYKTNYRLSDLSHYEIWISLKLDREKVFRDFREFTESPFFDSIKPFDGVPQIIKSLGPDYSQFIVTSRQNYLREKTLGMVNTYFGNSIEGVLLLDRFNDKGEEKNLTKVELCRKRNLFPYLFVDDQPVFAAQFASAGVKSILFDKDKSYPWTHNAYIPDVEVAHSWGLIQKRALELRLK